MRDLDEYSYRRIKRHHVDEKDLMDGEAAGYVSDLADACAFPAAWCTCHPRGSVTVLFSADFSRARDDGAYPTSILGGRYPITSVRDLTTGYDNTKPGNKAVLPVSKSSQMITFTFKNGLVTTLRTSGTEPKIKYYNELCASPDQKDLRELQNILSEMVSAIVKEFLQPEANNLIARSC